MTVCQHCGVEITEENTVYLHEGDDINQPTATAPFSGDINYNNSNASEQNDCNENNTVSQVVSMDDYIYTISYFAISLNNPHYFIEDIVKPLSIALNPLNYSQNSSAYEEQAIAILSTLESKISLLNDIVISGNDNFTNLHNEFCYYLQVYYSACNRLLDKNRTGDVQPAEIAEKVGNIEQSRGAILDIAVSLYNICLVVAKI